MANNKKHNSSLVQIMSTLGWPLAIGAALGTAFYAFLLRGPLDIPILQRYFASHPVAYVATIMFFIGLAALLVRTLNVAGQFYSLGKIRLPAIPAKGNRIEDADSLIAEIDTLPTAARQSYLGSRLRQALSGVRRNASADGLDEDLRYLADVDADRQHDGYSLVRIIIWATPMLGFLGTVIGITQALGDLATRQMGGDLQNAMQGLLSGLYVAFDTTALALSLSIVLMFLQFLVDRCETQLMLVVDRTADQELVGRFQQLGAAHDPHLASIQQMCQQVVESTESLASQQLETWQQALETVSGSWIGIGQQAGEQLASSLENSLSTVLQENVTRWAGLQHQAATQTEQLGQVLTETANVVRLETALERNLKQLAAAGQFHEAVTSLSAAIQLLVARVGITTDQGTTDNEQRAA